MEFQRALLGLSLSGLQRPGFQKTGILRRAFDSHLTQIFIMVNVLVLIKSLRVLDENPSLLVVLNTISYLTLALQVTNLRTFYTTNKAKIMHLIEKFNG